MLNFEYVKFRLLGLCGLKWHTNVENKERFNASLFNVVGM
jgi:hypothetical protein